MTQNIKDLIEEKLPIKAPEIISESSSQLEEDLYTALGIKKYIDPTLSDLEVGGFIRNYLSRASVILMQMDGVQYKIIYNDIRLIKKKMNEKYCLKSLLKLMLDIRLRLINVFKDEIKNITNKIDEYQSDIIYRRLTNSIELSYRGERVNINPNRFNTLTQCYNGDNLLKDIFNFCK